MDIQENHIYDIIGIGHLSYEEATALLERLAAIEGVWHYDDEFLGDPSRTIRLHASWPIKTQVRNVLRDTRKAPRGVQS